MVIKRIVIFFWLTVCSFAGPILNSFNAGELSPLMTYRIDTDKRASGVETLENMLIKPQGAVIRRPGTYYITRTKNNTIVRLIPFEYAATDVYILEFGNEYIRFYRNGGQIHSGGIPYEITSPYSLTDLSHIQYVQKNDVLYLICDGISPRKLSRYGHTNWTLTEVDWLWGPFLDENTTTTTIDPSGITGNITLTASAAIFSPSQIGALWKITERADNSYVSGNLAATGSSAEISIEGEYLLTLDGTWTGLITIEKSNNSGVSWQPVYPKLNNTATAVEYSGNEPEQGYSYRVTADAAFVGSCDYTLTAYNSNVAGYVKITAYTSPTIVSATVISDLSAHAAVTTWAEGAWSPCRGYPRSVCFYQNRIILGGSTYLPTTVWMSVSGNAENMRSGSDDSAAIIYEIGNAKQNPIMWMQDRKGIIIGTSGSIIILSSSGTSNVLTASTIASEIQSQNGSSNIQAILANNYIYYISRDLKKIRSIGYDLASESFVSPDVTIFAEHITISGIVGAAIQNSPDTIAWFYRTDGELIGLTLNQEQNVFAWHIHPMTNGLVRSTAVCPGYPEDELWMCIQRTTGSGTVYYIEQMQPQNFGNDTENLYFVDCGLTYNGPSTTIVSGLSHLEGLIVQVFSNGGHHETATVSGGKITTQESISKAAVGLGYTSKLITFPIEFQIPSGFSIGYKKKIPEITVCFYKTFDCEYGRVGGTMYPVRFLTGTTLGSVLPILYTCQKTLPMDGSYDDELRLYLRQTKPYPMGITAIAPKVEISDN